MMRLAALFLAFIVLASAVEPALKMTITSSGLAHACDVALAELRKTPMPLHIPDYHGEHSTPIGKAKVDLTNILLDTVVFDTMALQTTPPRDMTGAVVISNVAVHMNWHVKVSILSDGGSADITASQTSALIRAALGQDATGHPSIHSDGTAVGLSGLHVKVHSKWSWLENFLLDIFSGQIKHLAEDQLAQAITDQTNSRAEAILRTIPLEEVIAHGVAIDYSLVAPPEFASDFMSMFVLGEFVNKPPLPNPPCPSPHHALPDHLAAPRHLYAMFDQASFESAGWAVLQQGALDIIVTDAMIPKEVPFRLNTETFVDLIPPLEEKYPNTPMQLEVKLDGAPQFPINDTAISGLIPFDLTFSVVTSGTHRLGGVGALVPAFTIQANALFSGSCGFGNQRLTAHLTYLGAKLSVKWTAPWIPGGFDVEPMQEIVTFALSDVALPMVNGYLAKGVAIPTVEGCTLKDEVLYNGPGYVGVAANFDVQV